MVVFSAPGQVRMQADTLLPAGDPNRRGYKHVGDALLRMAREEGARGFFVGASPTVYRGLAVNVGMLSTYATFKEWVEPVLGDGRVTHFVAGAMSGATAATASLPFDFIKVSYPADGSAAVLVLFVPFFLISLEGGAFQLTCFICS